jgi:hypothetical protein
MAAPCAADAGRCYGSGRSIARSARPARLEGTDLELPHNLHGDNFVMRVNKGGMLVFRAMLRDAALSMLESGLVRFNSPDLAFTIGCP